MSEDTALVNGKTQSILKYHEKAPGRYTPPWEHQERRESFIGFDVALATRRLKDLNAIPYQLALDSIRTSLPVRRYERTKITQAEYAREYAEGRVLIVWLSRVAINDGGNQALVYCDYSCGDLCGAGLWIWLRKTQSDWQVAEPIQVWVS